MLFRSGNEEEKAFVVAVPYLRDGDYMRGLNYAAGVIGFLQQAVAKAQTMRRPEEAVILLAHLYARGSEIAENSSERVMIGGAEMVVLEPLVEDVSLTLLGHIHKLQCIGGRPEMRYLGSALPMSFTERGYQHGVELAVFDDGKLKEEPLFIEYTPLHPLQSIPRGPATWPVVKQLLGDLPDRSDSDTTLTYLEVNILQDVPDPGLTKEVEDCLRNKAVNLCRIATSYRIAARVEAEEVLESTDDLLLRNPLDIIRSGFERKHGCAMTDELIILAEQAYQDQRAKLY